MAPIYIQQNSVFDLAREIKTLLASNNIEVVKNSIQSKSQLILINEEKSRRVLSVDGSGQAREYLLTYKVNFEIKTSSQEIIKTKKLKSENAVEGNNEESVSVSRTWLFDPAAVLAVSNEAEILYKDMQREAARLILLRINAQSKNKMKKSENNLLPPVKTSVEL